METIYFGGKPVAQYNPASEAWTDLIYAGSSMIAEVAGTQTALPTYRHLDHLGSLAVQTNNSGTVTGSNVFLPFGDLLSSTTSDVFQYTGLPQDTENSSVHATYRNLSTTQSRWLRPDPYNGSYDITNPQSFNRYVYAMNNPLAYVDSTGLDGDCGITCWGEDGGGTGGAGGGGDPLGYGGGGVSDPCAGATVCVVGTPDPCAGATVCVVGTPDPTPPDPQPPNPPSPIPPLVPVVFNPPPGPPGQPSSGGGSSTIGSASSKPKQPQKPQHFWQKPGCKSNLEGFGVATLGEGLTVGGVVSSFYLGPEMFEGAEGLVAILHVSSPAAFGSLAMGATGDAAWSACIGQ